MAEKCLLEIIIKKISKNKPLELQDSLMKPDFDALKNASNTCKNKRKNILNVLDNIELSVFDGTYFHQRNQSLESEESIAERTKLRRQRFDEIVIKENMISYECLKNILVIRVQVICTGL